MRYTFTGPRKLTAEQRLVAYTALAYLEEAHGTPTECTTGAQVGIDVFCEHHLLSLYPGAWHRVVVPAAPCEQQRQPLLNEVVRLPLPAPYTYRDLEDPKVRAKVFALAYRQRNMRMLVYIDPRMWVPNRKYQGDPQGGLLVALPHTAKEVQRSGTWQTIRMARKRNLPVVAYPLDGTGQVWLNTPD